MEAAWRQEGEDMMDRGEMGCNAGSMEARIIDLDTKVRKLCQRKRQTGRRWTETKNGVIFINNSELFDLFY